MFITSPPTPLKAYAGSTERVRVKTFPRKHLEVELNHTGSVFSKNLSIINRLIHITFIRTPGFFAIGAARTLNLKWDQESVDILMDL